MAEISLFPSMGVKTVTSDIFHPGRVELAFHVLCVPRITTVGGGYYAGEGLLSTPGECSAPDGNRTGQAKPLPLSYHRGTTITPFHVRRAICLGTHPVDKRTPNKTVKTNVGDR